MKGRTIVPRARRGKPPPSGQAGLRLSSEKIKNLLFLKKKKQKDFCSWCCVPVGGSTFP